VFVLVVAFVNRWNECALANNVNHLVLMFYARAALAIFTPFTLCAVLFSLELSLGTRTGLAM
jgi:hypothetical protein